MSLLVTLDKLLTIGGNRASLDELKQVIQGRINAIRLRSNFDGFYVDVDINFNTPYGRIVWSFEEDLFVAKELFTEFSCRICGGDREDAKRLVQATGKPSTVVTSPFASLGGATETHIRPLMLRVLTPILVRKTKEALIKSNETSIYSR